MPQIDGDDIAAASHLRIHDLFHGVAEAKAERTAVTYGGERRGYRELQRDIDAYAHGLIAAGVCRGDRIAMATPPSLDFWVVFHAATSIGATWVGINPRYQARDIEHLVNDAKPALIVAVSPFEDRDYCAEIRKVAPNTPIVAHGAASSGAASRDDFLRLGEAVDAERLEEARQAVASEDPALIVYTSGTTGKPKGAMLSHRAIVTSALMNLSWMRPEALASSICAAPVNHVGAINNLCMPVLAAGGHLIFHPRVDIAAIGEISRRERPTYLVSSPTGFAMMLQEPEGMAMRLGNTRLIVFGGAPTGKSVLDQFARPPLRLTNVYGQTETCGIITKTAEGASTEVMAETIGVAIPGSQVRVANAGNDGEAAAGEAGEIQVRGPYVMSGYFRNPEATAAAFTADGYLRTGDIGTRRADGNIVFVGRLKEMFKSGGYNVYPVEIEQAICEHPGVALAAVVAVDHPTFQEVGHAFVELAPGASLAADELREFLRSRIANYKVPKAFTVEPELPRLPNGKVDKMALKARATSP